MIKLKIYNIINMNSIFLCKPLLDNYSKNNTIVRSIVYILNKLNKDESNIIYMVRNIQQYMNYITSKNNTLEFLIIPFIYIYNSYQIIYNLPHMLNKPLYKEQPSINIIFGEIVTQLTSITLLSEAINILNNSKIDKTFLNDININDLNDKILENDDNYKDLLLTHKKKYNKILFNKLYKISLSIYNVTENEYLKEQFSNLLN